MPPFKINPSSKGPPLKSFGFKDPRMAPMNHLGMTEQAYRIVQDKNAESSDDDVQQVIEKHVLLEEPKPKEQKPLTEEEKRNLIFTEMSAS